MTVEVPYDKSVASTIVASYDTFFEDLITQSDNTRSDWNFCVHAFVSCTLVDASDKPFIYPGLTIGDRGDRFSLYAPTQVDAGATISLYYKCVNELQTIKTS